MRSSTHELNEVGVEGVVVLLTKSAAEPELWREHRSEPVHSGRAGRQAACAFRRAGPLRDEWGDAGRMAERNACLPT